MTKTYLTKQEALKTYPLKEKELDQLIKEKRVDYALLGNQDDQVIIYYDDALASYIAERDITPEKFAHLKGEPISIADAGIKYKVDPRVIFGWVKQGKLTILERGVRNKITLDESQVAYMAEIGKAKKMRPGKKPFS